MKKIILNIINRLAKKYDTRDPCELADYLGVVIIERPLGDKLGAYMYIKKTKTIFINSSIDEALKKIVLAHELGHAILHKTQECYFMKSNTLIVTSKFEWQANFFAANLLISDNLIDDYYGYTIDEISNTENIPVELLKLKFDLI
jgi:Zn-dependent peptidase ImmA (M78 family)